MKTRTTKILATGLVAFAILVSSCSKTNTTGPIGATGAAGANGSNGLNGATGPQGAQGNANVQSTAFTINTWAPTVGSTSVTSQQTTLSLAGITQDVVTNGAVLVYSGISQQSPSWTALPYAVPNGTSGLSLFYNFTYSIGAVQISVSQSNGSDPGNLGNAYFKVVVIAGSFRKAHPNLNYKNYDEVMRVVSLENKTN